MTWGEGDGSRFQQSANRQFPAAAMMPISTANSAPASLASTVARRRMARGHRGIPHGIHVFEEISASQIVVLAIRVGLLPTLSRSRVIRARMSVVWIARGRNRRTRRACRSLEPQADRDDP
ncbi:hypothetical protein GGE48_005329 [Rhizobium leguminosarum]|nr:hypothetical protein [Rhizobium leguminosarum]